jgi:hypothetical protein
MRKILRIVMIIFVTIQTINLYAQSAELVNVKFRNNSLMPKKVTFISYSPNEQGNATRSHLMMPGFSKKIMYAEGTKVYIANSAQIGTVMSGKRIDNQQAFLVVKKSESNKVVKLRD